MEKDNQGNIIFVYLCQEIQFNRFNKFSDLKEDLKKKFFLCKSMFDNMRITYVDKSGYTNMVYDEEDYRDEECKSATKFYLNIPNHLTDEVEKTKRLKEEIEKYENGNKQNIQNKMNEYKDELENRSTEYCYIKIKELEKQNEEDIKKEENKYKDLLKEYDIAIEESCKKLLNDYTDEILGKEFYDNSNLTAKFGEISDKIKDNLGKAVLKKVEKFQKINTDMKNIYEQIKS